MSGLREVGSHGTPSPPIGTQPRTTTYMPHQINNYHEQIIPCISPETKQPERNPGNPIIVGNSNNSMPICIPPPLV